MIQKKWKELDVKEYKVIMDEFGISLVTAKKYIHMSEEEIRALDHPTVYKAKKKPTNDYVNIIYKMFIDGVNPEIIFSYVCKSGYCGTWSALSNHIGRILKNNFGVKIFRKWYLKSEYPKDITVIKRNEILIYITTKNEKKAKSKKVEANIALIEEKYPIIKSLKEIFDSFHSTLMGNDSDELSNFIEKYRDSRVKGFVEGIEKDIAPIKNAISLPNSSGFVEGNNNKFKLIKRILYGRSNLVNLFRKCYLPFLMNNTDIDLMAILKNKSSTISCTA